MTISVLSKEYRAVLALLAQGGALKHCQYKLPPRVSVEVVSGKSETMVMTYGLRPAAIRSWRVDGSVLVLNERIRVPLPNAAAVKLRAVRSLVFVAPDLIDGIELEAKGG